MKPLRLPADHRLRLAWLLCLALLLPLAQSMAGWHLLSHVHTSATHDDDATTAGEACDLCLLAAGVASGGVATTGRALAAPAPAADWQGAILAASWIAAPALAYRSRAPPLSLG
jgi:hypothetical protein